MKRDPLIFALTHLYRGHKLDYRAVVAINGARWEVIEIWLILFDDKPSPKKRRCRRRWRGIQRRALHVWVAEVESSKTFVEMVYDEVKRLRREGVIP